LLHGFQAAAVIADKAYDSNDLRQIIHDAGMTAVTLNTLASCADPARHRTLKARNRIERCFNKLKHFRRFTTRFDRRAVHFLAFIHIASVMI
jgi:transposase